MMQDTATTKDTKYHEDYNRKGATTKPTKKHEEVRKSQPRRDTKKIKYCSMQEVNEDIKVVMMMQSLKIAS